MRLSSDKWDVSSGAVLDDRVAAAVSADLNRFSFIIKRLENRGAAYTSADVAEGFRQFSSHNTVFKLICRSIDRLRRQGRMRTAETYSATLNNLFKFCDGVDMPIDRLTSDFMEEYEGWNRSRGNSSNTVSFYNRILRAVYNRAVDDGIIESTNPFRRVYTGVDKTIKRALPIDALRRIKTLDLSDSPTLMYARDMFLLSFMLRGMSFVDMAFLKKTDLRCGYIEYRRRKTGQLMTVRWIDAMQTILDRYPPNSSCYLLPIIRRSGLNERCAYRNTAYNINRSLKTIARMAGIEVPLTMYVARHSWASVARSKGVPVSVISEGMGHDSESTTQIYLSSLNTSVIDKANKMIVALL